MKIKSGDQSKNALGSVAWGESSKGVLNEHEKIRVVENLKFVMSQEQLDADRRRLGLLNPKYILIETLTPPDSKMVKDALAYAEETHVAPLLRHSWRTYYFGALIASHDGIEFAPQLEHVCSNVLRVLLSFEASLNAGQQRPQNPLDVNSFACHEGVTPMKRGAGE